MEAGEKQSLKGYSPKHENTGFAFISTKYKESNFPLTLTPDCRAEEIKMIILLLTILFTKHLILDFIYQPPYQWQNKGTYGHMGGIVHAGQHILGSMILVFWFPLSVLWPVLIAEFIIHYHMDWFKMWWGAKKGYGANTHVEFWYWMGIDQWVHSLTYLAMIWYLI